jgi:hypothetical protein
MSDRREIPILSVLPAKRFHSCVLTTYSFDFNYFNHDALATLSRAGVRNICVYVDDSMLQQYLGSLSGYASGAAKRYSLSGVVRQGAFHPKMNLFFGRDGHGFLIIGSGNLTAAGHVNNQELWGAFHIDGPNDPKASLFKQAWKYAKTIGNETPGMALRKLEWIETHTPWLQDIPEAGHASGLDIGNGVQAYFLTNTGNGILHDLRAIVQDDVVECTVISPFFDQKAAVLFELERLYPNAQIHTIVQPDTCIGGLAGKNFDRVRFYDWNTIVNEKRKRYLHAKLLHIRTVSTEYCLFGSANLTAPALGTASILPSNEEVCLLFKRDTGNWLDEIGLINKGDTIAAVNVSNHVSDRTTDEEPDKHPSIRLKAIDRINTHLHVYLENHDVLQNTFLVLFDGWGEEKGRIELINSEFKEDTGYYDVISDKLPEELLYGQLFDRNDTATSNKQIIHDMVLLSRTNPDPSTQRLEEVLDRIEFADAEMIEILSYLDPEDLSDEKLSGTGWKGKDDTKAATESDGSGKVLPYDEFTKISPEYQHKGGFSYLYGTHRIERILETLRFLFEKLNIRDIDISGRDEEADKETVDSSAGRVDEEPTASHVPPQTLSAFASLQKTVFRFFNQYIAILEKQREKKHRVNVLDASMFAIALHLLLDFLDKPIPVKKKTEDEEYEEILLKAKGKYFVKEDYCRIVTEIIGKFTMLLINGIDDANDEYVRRRIDKCRRMAFWHAVCCIARLVPCDCKDKDFTDYSPLWKWELGMNLRHFYGTDDSKDAMRAREEIEHRIQMMHGMDKKNLEAKCLRAFNRIDKDYSDYEKRKTNQAPSFEISKRVFCRLSGFSHVFFAIRTGSGYKVTLARAGYPISKTGIWDFEEGKKVMAVIAKIEVL